MNKSVININKNQIILPLLLFLAVMVLTQYLAYQQYLLTKDRERTVLQNELSNVRYRFANLLETDINKANTISILYDQIGLKSEFEEITGKILKTSKSIDVIQLVNNDIITHVYPL